MDQDTEQFPMEKRLISCEEAPELIFFDVDDEKEEADFIRVDDLFAMDEKSRPALTGHLTFTLFPGKIDALISSRDSRLIHRTLVLTSLRLQRPLEKVRVRPRFVQWQIELNDEDKAKELAREFREDLEDQIQSLHKADETERYWSNSFFISPIDREISDDVIIRIAADYQKKADEG